jgi:hypothetical protein
MTHDPYKLCADVTCPHCGVKGRIVSEVETRPHSDYGDDDFDLLTCVECGGLHESHGSSGDEHLKLMRIQFGRLIEGRPYEAPKPVVRDPSWKPVDMSAFDRLIEDYYSPRVTINEPELASIASLKKSARAWALSQDTWILPAGARPTTMPDTRETDEKIRKLVAEMQRDLEYTKK